MGKRLNYSRRVDSIVPQGDVGALMHPGRLKEYVKTAKPQDRQRLVAFLHSIYTGPELVEMLGITRGYIKMCSQRHKDIVEASQLSRNLAIADLTERRVVELLQKMNVDNIPDDKKPQSVKYLMDSADLARGQTKPADEQKDEDVMELVLKVRKKMTSHKEEERDITDEVEVHKEEKTVWPATCGKSESTGHDIPDSGSGGEIRP